jgi:hypothetical protein
MSRNEILQFVYTSILEQYAMDDDQSDALDATTSVTDANVRSPPSKDKRVSQGADLLLFIRAGTWEEQLDLATKLVAATKPSEWPPQAIASRILVSRDLLCGEPEAPDYDPEAGRCVISLSQFQV